MRERPNRHAWKACVGQPTVGSNPTPSALGCRETGDRACLQQGCAGRQPWSWSVLVWVIAEGDGFVAAELPHPTVNPNRITARTTAAIAASTGRHGIECVRTEMGVVVVMVTPFRVGTL